MFWMMAGASPCSVRRPAAACAARRWRAPPPASASARPTACPPDAARISHRRKQPEDPFQPRHRRSARRAPPPAEHVLAHREVGENAHVLGHVGDAAPGDFGRRPRRDVLAVEPDAAGRVPQTHDGAQRGGLAGAVAAEQHGQRAARHHEIDAVQDVIRPDVRVHAFEAQQRRRAPCFSPSPPPDTPPARSAGDHRPARRRPPARRCAAR